MPAPIKPVAITTRRESFSPRTNRLKKTLLMNWSVPKEERRDWLAKAKEKKVSALPIANRKHPLVQVMDRPAKVRGVFVLVDECNIKEEEEAGE